MKRRVSLATRRAIGASVRAYWANAPQEVIDRQREYGRRWMNDPAAVARVRAGFERAMQRPRVAPAAKDPERVARSKAVWARLTPEQHAERVARMHPSGRAKPGHAGGPTDPIEVTRMTLLTIDSIASQVIETFTAARTRVPASAPLIERAIDELQFMRRQIARIPSLTAAWVDSTATGAASIRTPSRSRRTRP